MECFAFGGAIVRFAPLETSFHAANHTIPPPPSYEGLSRCPKDKKLLAVSRRKNPDDKMISWRGCIKSSKTILYGRDATLRVRDK